MSSRFGVDIKKTVDQAIFGKFNQPIPTGLFSHNYGIQGTQFTTLFRRLTLSNLLRFNVEIALQMPEEYCFEHKDLWYNAIMT